MQLITIERIQEKEKQTLGELTLYDGNNNILFECKTLELPWKSNKKYVSCIPEGFYTAKKHISPDFGECLWLQDVHGRTEILIHLGNFYDDILGCILVGESYVDIDNDGYRDVNNSKNTMKKLLNHIDNDTIDIHIRKR